MNFKFLFNDNLADNRLMQSFQDDEQLYGYGSKHPGLSPEVMAQAIQTQTLTGASQAPQDQSIVTLNVQNSTEIPISTNQNYTWKTPDGIDLSSYKGMWSYNDSKSAKWNRKNLKGFLKDQGLGDKADATGMIAEYLQHKFNQDPTSVSGSDRRWIKSKAGQYGYTLDQGGNRDYYKKTPSWVQTLATVFGGLTLGPVGATAGYTLFQPKKPIDGYDGFYNPKIKRIKRPNFNKNGGIMQKFQQGGQVDPEEQLLLAATLSVIGYAKSQGTDVDIQTAASQVVDILQQDPNQLTQLVQNEELIKAGTQSLKPADIELYEKLKQPGAMKQYMSQIASNKSSNTVTKNQKTKAMKGTKLNYIKELKGICPEGYEMQYFAAGGHICSRCAAKKKIEEAKCGKKMKKHEDGDKVEPNNGAVSPHVQKVKQDIQDSLSKNDSKHWRGPIPTTPRTNATSSKHSNFSKRSILPNRGTRKVNIESKSKK